MTDFQEQLAVPAQVATPLEPVTNNEPVPLAPPVEVPVSPTPESVNGDGATHHWHAEAGRKGARRVHQLIREGKLYEQEHGLKSGRQRLRQLIELGKLYEQEHGSRQEELQSRGPQRLSRMGREELLTTLFQCLQRLAKPSFRKELAHLAKALQEEEKSPTA